MEPIRIGWKFGASVTWRVWNFGFGLAYYGRGQFLESHLSFGPFSLNVWREVGLDEFEVERQERYGVEGA